MGSSVSAGIASVRRDHGHTGAFIGYAARKPTVEMREIQGLGSNRVFPMGDLMFYQYLDHGHGECVQCLAMPNVRCMPKH